MTLHKIHLHCIIWNEKWHYCYYKVDDTLTLTYKIIFKKCNGGLWPLLLISQQIWASTWSNPYMFINLHVCTLTCLYPNIYSYPNIFLPWHVCTLTDMYPDISVPSHVCIPTCSYPACWYSIMFVPQHFCTQHVHTMKCTYHNMFIPQHFWYLLR